MVRIDSITEVEKAPSEPFGDLPPELMKELHISPGDVAQENIRVVLQECGRPMTLNEVLIAIYKRFGAVEKRATLGIRLGKMARNGIILKVPKRKGVYSMGLGIQVEAERNIAPCGDV